MKQIVKKVLIDIVLWGGILISAFLVVVSIIDLVLMNCGMDCLFWTMYNK